MIQFTTLFQKEWRESWRSFKLIWVPLVFLLLGITDAILNYFMEDILSSVGNMPDGMQIILPEFTALDIYSAATGQFQSIGLIILVAVFASSISRERQNGTGALLYVRPLTYRAYYMSKWVMANMLALIALALGYGGSYYYTSLLYERVPFSNFLAMVGTYFIWIVFVITFVLTMSALFKTAIAMALSIVVIPVFLIFDSLIGSYWTVSPWKLGNYGLQQLMGDVDTNQFITTVLITLCLTILFIVIGIWGSRKNASQAKL